MDNPMGAAVAADGGLFIVDKYNHRIRKISSNFPGFNVTDIAISSEDGAQIFRFNGKELHLNTMNALTKTVLYSFAYDIAGRLNQIIDGDGK